MDGVEIVITPRTLERIIFLTVIAVLLVAVVIGWGGKCTEPANAVTANVVAQSTPLQDAENNSTPSVAASLESKEPCSNSAKDGTETDIDCGGSCSVKCGEFKACNVDKDCDEELYCYQHIKCMKPSCDDGIKNQDETNIDCGGSCAGYWWVSDKKCHDAVEPSGKLDLQMSADIGRSANSGNAIIKSVTLSFDNGLGKDAPLTIELFARTPNGGIIFENQDGEIAIETSSFTVAQGQKLTKTLDLTTKTRSTLPAVKSTEAFQIHAVVKDSSKKTVIDEYSWTNS